MDDLLICLGVKVVNDESSFGEYSLIWRIKGYVFPYFAFVCICLRHFDPPWHFLVEYVDRYDLFVECVQGIEGDCPVDGIKFHFP